MTDENRHLVRGGQGRDDEQLVCDGVIVGVCIFAVCGFILGFVVGLLF